MLSTGQINDAFTQALGRQPTGQELQKYGSMGNLEGSGGQQTLVSMLKGGGSSSSTAASDVSGVNYAGAYQTASAQIPQIDTSSLQSVADSIMSSAKLKSQNILSSVPTVQNIYSDLAKQLLSKFQTDTATAQENKTKAVGSETAAAAASGIDTTTGYEAALVRGISSDQDKIIKQISDQYGVDADKLTQEESKDVSTLVQEANDALTKGEEDQANIIGKIIDLKLQQSQLVATAANNILSAQSKEAALAAKNDYQSALLDFKQQTINLEAQRLMMSGGGATAQKNQALSDASSDASKGATLRQLISAYPDIDANTLFRIYNTYNYTSGGKNVGYGKYKEKPNELMALGITNV